MGKKYVIKGIKETIAVEKKIVSTKIKPVKAQSPHLLTNIIPIELTIDKNNRIIAIIDP
jgi:hypothetical protein